MATVTDLTGSSVSVVDSTSVVISEDSNVNVFEFGNLILADILPTLWFVNYTSDLKGNSSSVVDQHGSSGSVTNSSGSLCSVVDISGS
jgi:hypothetical protein